MSAQSNGYFDAHWMPFTANREFKARPRIIVSATGSYFTDERGRKIFDGLSGLWTCGAGHARREISEAVSQQISRLDYAPAFQFGHPGSFELANRIVEFMPPGLNRVFFTSSGSEAVDSALKMARAYWRLQGRAEKTRLIGRIKGYHGVNFGGMSVGGIGPNRAPFGQGIQSDHLASSLLEENRFCQGQPANGAFLADALLDKIALHDASTIAAVVVEPMAGSAGVIPPPVGYLQRLREICDAHDILLIFDEVITAFGRMGANTGAAAFGVTPDLITFAKQVSNGAQALGGVVVKQSIYDDFMAQPSPDYLVELPHGYTYSAHPVACAAALATLDVLQNDSLIERAQHIAPHFQQAVHELKGLPGVSDIRNIGLAAGLSFDAIDGQPALRPYQIAMKCWDKGFYVRYGGDTIQLAPPFIAENEEIDALVNALGESICETARSSNRGSE